jgi:hypothetical protein
MRQCRAREGAAVPAIAANIGMQPRSVTPDRVAAEFDGAVNLVCRRHSRPCACLVARKRGHGEVRPCDASCARDHLRHRECRTGAVGIEHTALPFTPSFKAGVDRGLCRLNGERGIERAGGGCCPGCCAKTVLVVAATAPQRNITAREVRQRAKNTQPTPNSFPRMPAEKASRPTPRVSSGSNRRQASGCKRNREARRNSGLLIKHK